MESDVEPQHDQIESEDQMRSDEEERGLPRPKQILSEEDIEELY